MFWIALCAFNFFFEKLRDVAQWMFAYEYYNMARIIPFVLDEINPPEHIAK